jgi:catechol 2,3-dioxygenase-like lactoylglutathione lyase family enzyme
MTAPRLKGLHHIKLPVTDLDTSLSWYQRVFDAEYQAHFDHYDHSGTRYAVILQLPGVDIPIELRWAPDAATATVGYDPAHFVAGDTDDLQAWVAHLDTLDIEHSPIITALAGQLLIFRDPDQRRSGSICRTIDETNWCDQNCDLDSMAAGGAW